ncbi:nitrate- and nitrite sensing domain-containing protein [Streptomyces sp. NPDC050315]|uniref:sensor histidine kinase n=1 Tax=Streptomyces sp. NPDC050315 TaxID=3155039 RepID=UPI003429B1BA
MRTRIICLLTAPVVALLALWGAATVTAVQDAVAARQAQRIEDEVRAPVYEVVRALQEERLAAIVYLADPTQARKDAFEARTGETKKATTRLRQDGRRTVAEAVRLPARRADRPTDLTTALDALPEQRRLTTERSLTWQQAYGPYTAAIASAFTLNAALSGPADGTRLVGELGRARELLAQENAVLTAADLTGTLDKERQRSFTGTVAARRLMESIATEDLPAPVDAAWSTLATGRAHADVRAMENAVSAATPGRGAAQAAPSARWRPSYEDLRRGLHGIEKELAADAVRSSGPLVYGVSPFAVAAVGIGFVALVLSLVVAVRIGRSLIRELTALRDSALGIARHRLPEVHAGRQADTLTASEARPTVDEIIQVRAALDSVLRAALDAVAERAERADGISGVCVNLARRSQVLLHRQLALLDSMERRSQDPAELGDLFRLDHLTTRMRRHAESLLILSGAAPGRAWRSPVPLTDVVRAAVSEIEDYARIEVRRLPAGAIPGGAVAELTHLLAELIENAAQFSPPHTKVRVQGEQVGTGHVLEIEDRGLEEAARDEANRRIEQAASLDPFDGDRLGLFVVSRLAARHGVRVVLRASPYGGTTAVVLLPNTLVHEATLPARSAPVGPPQDAPLERVRAHLERRTGRAVEPPADAAVTDSPDGVAPPDGPDGLPRRIRQRSLAVQLREPSPAVGDTSPEAEPELVPEQTRTRMTAYRHGWDRGSTMGEP